MPFLFLKLALRPTPIHPWRLSGVPDGFSISIKRDDLTGCTLSGNKVITTVQLTQLGDLTQTNVKYSIVGQNNMSN